MAKKAPNRTRKRIKRIALSEDEWAAVTVKMDQAHVTNFSDYARKMLCDGYVVYQTFDDLKELAGELGAIGRNINQIARRANETRSIYADDIADLKGYFAELRGRVSERLVKIIKYK